MNGSASLCSLHSRLYEHRLDTDWVTHLVGVVRQVGDGGGQAPLRGQQVGVLAHLLSQQDADSSRTRALSLLHGTTQHHHLLHQVLRDGDTKRSHHKIRTSALTYGQQNKLKTQNLTSSSAVCSCVSFYFKILPFTFMNLANRCSLNIQQTLSNHR